MSFSEIFVLRTNRWSVQSVVRIHGDEFIHVGGLFSLGSIFDLQFIALNSIEIFDPFDLGFGSVSKGSQA